MKTISATRLTELFGINQSTLRGWKARGLVRPAIQRPPYPDEYDVETALRIALTAAMRRRGLPFSTCTAVYNFLAARTIEQLKASVAGGKRWLLCVGPAVSPDLLPAEAINRRIESACDAAGLAFAVIDIGAALERLEAFIESTETET